MDLSTLAHSLREIADENRKGKRIVECIEDISSHTDDAEIQAIYTQTLEDLYCGKSLIDALKGSDVPYQALEFFREIEENCLRFDTATFFEAFADRMQPDWSSLNN